jgi:hypothetical protein
MGHVVYVITLLINFEGDQCKNKDNCLDFVKVYRLQQILFGAHRLVLA